MKSFQRGLLVTILVAAVSLECASAFDIAVYYDARSALNYRCQNADTEFCAAASRHDAIEHITNESDVFDWWDEMGVTHAIVHYPFDDDLLTLNDRDHTDIKILNASYPGETRKYLEAQNRDIYVGNSANDYPNYVNATCWGDTARGDTLLPVFNSSKNSLLMQSANAGTMWKPESDLGIWEGWDWHEAKLSGKIYMPMHFRMICNLVPVDNPPGDQEIARLYWLVKHDQGWIRYPAQIITVDSFRTNPSLPDTINFTIDPNPGAPGRFQLLDESFQEVPDSVYDRHSFGALWGEPVRMWIKYQGGNQIFQVHRVQTWDEGYNQLLMDPASMDTIEQFIDSVYRRQLNLAPGKMIGWYFDETQQQEAIDPWIRVNDILQSSNLPTMYLNGHYGYDTGDDWAQNTWRHKYYQKCDSAGVSIPAHMDEYYFLKDGFGCQPHIWGGSVPELLHVDSSSDATYIYADSTGCGLLPNDWVPQQRYEGHKSIQAAIDGTLYGWSQLYTIGDITSGPANLYAENRKCMVEQAKYNHSHGSRHWAMLQGYDDDSPNEGCCPIRIPSRNEVKLQAWLSVAADCDGMIWYPVYLGGGLLEYDPLEADFCPGALATGNASVIRTDRYFAARDVCNKIYQIAPVFEPLDFVRTYATRVFEQNYGSSDDEWVRTDYLAYTPRGRSYVQYIGSGDNPEDTYVQISRFQTPGVDSTTEDYWFLVVNRRARASEQRNVYITVENIGDPNALYLADRVIRRSVGYTGTAGLTYRMIPVEYLSPGDAELVHFYKADTTDWVITEADTILAPAYFHRNIIVRDGGSLTILPNYDALKDSYIVGESTHYRWDSVATVTFWQGKGIRIEGQDARTTFRVRGNDTTRIRFQAANTDQFWAGITITADRADTVDFRHAIIQDAEQGLRTNVLFSTPVDSNFFYLSECCFRDCRESITVGGQCLARIYNTDIVNDSCGLVLHNGVVANVHDCVIKNCSDRGITAWDHCTLNLLRTDIWSNGRGGIFTDDCDVRMKCCRVEKNVGTGVDIVEGSLLMADPEHSGNPKWGGNRIFDNSGVELIVTNNTRGFTFADGDLAPGIGTALKVRSEWYIIQSGGVYGTG